MKRNNKTKGIGFKNFRRFKEFPMLEFGNITYMVGRNNSGKSTMVKALLLTLDYLQNQLSNTLSFDSLSLEDVNIVTFDRAKCNLIDEPEIVFDLKLHNYNISIHISGIEGRTKANVNLLHIYDDNEGYSLKVNYLTELVQITKKSISETVQIDTSDEILKIKNEIDQLKESLKLIPNKVSKEALQIADQLNKLTERKNRIANNLESPLENDLEYNLEYPLNYQKKTKDPSLDSQFDESSRQKQSFKLREVDLNLARHNQDLGEIKTFEFLNMQLELAQRELEFAVDKDFPKVLFKNVGKGVFKEELGQLLNNYENLSFNFKDDDGGSIEVQLNYEDSDEQINYIKRTEDNELKEIVSTFLYYNSIAYIQLLDQRNSKTEYYEDDEDSSIDIIELDNSKEELKEWIDNLVLRINGESFHYLGANPSKQSALFYLRDKNNALAQAIHNFYQLGIQEGDEEWEFVKKWMSADIDINSGQSKGFEIGDNFKINFFSGEAYEFKVIQKITDTINPYNMETQLSDMGMGSLQAMLLILRVASLIKLNQDKKNKKDITILVEEPELNLHPALQSKLTDFFHEVNKKYGFNFIVETHSEYMIRKSQVLTKTQEYGGLDSLNPNPFKVFYFPVNLIEPPYEMKYRNDGKFMNDFKPGFFDVSSDLAFDIL